MGTRLHVNYQNRTYCQLTKIALTRRNRTMLSNNWQLWEILDWQSVQPLHKKGSWETRGRWLSVADALEDFRQTYYANEGFLETFPDLLAFLKTSNQQRIKIIPAILQVIITCLVFHWELFQFLFCHCRKVFSMRASMGLLFHFVPL